MSSRNTPGTQSIWIALLPMILYAAVLPYIIFRLASPHMTTISALLLAAVPPAVATAIGFIRSHRLNLFSTLALIGIIIKLISALLFKDIRLILISDSLMLGVYGILMLGSLLIGKPLLMTLALSMLANAPPEQRERFESRWEAAGSRSYFTLLTALWGMGLLLVLLVHIVLTFILTVAEFELVGPIVLYSTIGVLILGTQIYSRVRRYQKRRMLEQSQQSL